MKNRVCIITIVCFFCGCISPKESDFEKMLTGFPECNFKNLFVDYKTREPVHQYFIDRKMMPAKVENEAAFFNINERFHGLHANEIIISAGYAIVAIKFDEPLDVAENKIKGYLKYGYNKEPIPAGSDETMITPTLEPDVVEPNKAVLTCDFEPHYES